MWPWIVSAGAAAADSALVRTAATKVTSFWPSIVSGAKTAATTALGYLGFGEIGAGVAAASTGKTVASKVARGVAGVAASAVYDGKIKISKGDTPMTENLFNFNAVNFLSGNSGPTGGSMFEDTKRQAGEPVQQSKDLPFWAKAAITGALVIGTVMIVKGVMK